jgi:hypothetical protein
MKIYDCLDLTDFILARQIHQARQLVQAEDLWPRIAIFGEVSAEFRENLDEYFANFYDVAKKRNLIAVEFFAADDLENFAKINANENAEFQGILAKPESLTEEISQKKDIFGLRENSDFDAPETLARKYLVAGFDLADDFFTKNADENFAKIKNFATLEIAALVDNLLRTCAENFAKK